MVLKQQSVVFSNMIITPCNVLTQFQTHLTFGQEFTQAVEMKQVAQQDAERARYLVEKVSGRLISSLWESDTKLFDQMFYCLSVHAILHLHFCG